jgi:hypothetical protein
MKSFFIAFVAFFGGLLININYLGAQTNIGNCFSQSVTNEIKTTIANYERNGYALVKTGSEEYQSTVENKHVVQLVAGKSYLFFLKTEPYVDQSSIVLANNYGVVVQSVFRETGTERNSVMLQYSASSNGLYNASFKMVDYSGRSVCGSWLIMSR